MEPICFMRFALFLLFEELALAGDVAAVALAMAITFLRERLDGLGGDHLCADGGLDAHLVLLAGTTSFSRSTIARPRL